MQQLLLLHGAIGAKDQLEPLAAALKDEYIIHTINFSGHGGKAFPEDGFSISCFANEILVYLRQNNLKNINIFGYSMGGYVAMYLARHCPQMITRVITLATKFYWDQAIAAKEIKMLEADTILEKLPAYAKALERRHLPNDWKTVLDRTKGLLLQLGVNNKLQLKDYINITASCLLLLGDNDKMISPDEAIAVKRALPDAEFKLLPDTPHPIEQVSMELLSSLIKEFVK